MEYSFPAEGKNSINRLPGSYPEGIIFFKMKNVFLILLSIYSLNLFSQNTFFKIYEHTGHERGFECVETTDGDYIIVGERVNDYSYQLSHGLIYLLDPLGNLTTEYELNDSLNNSFLMTINQSLINPGQFLVYGTKRFFDGQDTCSEMIQLTIDNDLNILNLSTFFFLRNHWSYPWKTELASDSIIYILIGDYSLQWNSPQFGIAKIRLPDDSITSWFPQQPAPGIDYDAYDLHIQYDPEVIKVFYFGQLLEDINSLQIARFNPDLSLMGSSTMPGSYIHSGPNAVNFSDTSYIFTATTSTVSIPIQHICIYKMNEANDSILKQVEYANSLDTILYSGGGTNTAISGHSIFITGIYNIIPFQIPWQTSPMWIQITRTDLDLNIISHHFYGGDAEYLPYCIAPTSDGGAIVTGFVWDYNIPENYQYDIFALKFDTAGVVTGIGENEKQIASEAIVYPNPGSDYLMALLGAQHKSADLSLLDITGKTMLHCTLNQYQTRISTAHLPAGTYLYSITAGNRLIGSGKWVRQ